MKLHTISINNLKRRKAKMAFLTIGLMVGIATIVTLVTLTRSMSSDIEHKMVAGILDQTGSQDDSLVFAPLGKAQKLLGKEGKITMAEVAALCSGCPIGDMVTQIAEKLPDTKVSAIQQVVEGRLKALGQFKRFSFAMAGVGRRCRCRLLLEQA